MISCDIQEFSSNKAILFSETSDFQSILVFRSAQYGNCLVLDGVIQMTTRDEFAYHEMMVHLPLCTAQSTTPLDILIVGGGDGGVLREVVTQYDKETVRSITVVDIDPMVTEVAKKYLNAAPYFDDDRVMVVHADAAVFLDDDDAAQKYHVIIGDTSDPVGPAESLFQPAFYESMYAALKPGGIICVQGECFWIHLVLISDLIACCNDIFDTAEYATTMVPTYPCGQIGFVLARKRMMPGRPCPSCRIPIRTPKNLTTLKWYSPEIHRAAFVLPPFVRAQLEGYDDVSDTYQVGDHSCMGGTNGGIRDDEEEEEVYQCFCKDLVNTLPRRIGIFKARDDDHAENSDCLHRGSFGCAIM